MNRFHLSQKGSILMLMAFTIPFLFAISAIAVDCGYLYVQRSHMQNMADAAVLAGASKLGAGTTDAQNLALTYIDKNKKALDGNIALDKGIKFDFPNENNVKKIRVDIEESVHYSQLPFMSSVISLFKFSDDPIKLTVHAIASYSGSAPGIFDYSIISGGDGIFYLNGEKGSGTGAFNGLIHSNGKFEFDTTGSGSLNNVQLNADVTISTPEYSIAGLNNRKDLKKYFSYDANKIDITENNPTISNYIVNLKKNATEMQARDIGSNRKLSSLGEKVYIHGNFDDNSRIYYLAWEPSYSRSITIVADGDIKLGFSNVNISKDAEIILCSLSGNIVINTSQNLKISALAPKGNIELQGGSAVFDGFLIGQSISIGQGNRTYQNSRWSGGGGSGSGKVRLTE
jgi:hypothetical protein